MKDLSLTQKFFICTVNEKGNFSSYDQVPVKWVEPDLALACRRFVNNLTGGDGQIFATYTAMLKIRDQLEQMNQEDR